MYEGVIHHLIIYSLGLKHNTTFLSHVLYYSSTFKSKQYMQEIDV